MPVKSALAHLSLIVIQFHIPAGLLTSLPIVDTSSPCKGHWEKRLLYKSQEPHQQQPQLLQGLLLDETDQKILNLLARDGRLSYRNFAHRPDLTTKGVKARINKIEQLLHSLAPAAIRVDCHDYSYVSFELSNTGCAIIMQLLKNPRMEILEIAKEIKRRLTCSGMPRMETRV